MTDRSLSVLQPTRVALAACWSALAAVSIFGLLILNMVYSAPEPPGFDAPWRWSAIVLSFGLSFWNVYSAYRAYLASGFLSWVGFLHAWLFVAFSFAALETTYRYDRLELLYWGTDTDDPLLLAAVIMLGAFQGLFFFAVGREPHRRVEQLASSSKAERPNLKLAAVFFLLAVPLVVARLDVIFDLGLQGAVETMVSRTPYTERLSEEQGAIGWLLTSVFPIYFAPLLCLGIKYSVRHPSATGALMYLGAFIIGGAGAVITGGRGELVYLLFVVLGFMYVQGYRKLGQYKLLILPILVLGLMLFLVAQARHGADNALTGLGTETTVKTSDYSAGDFTQIHGLGRFDAAVMIVDKSVVTDPLWGKSYLYAVGEGLNAAFVPRIVLGDYLPSWRISDSVMGYWIFATPKASALPSAPGELLLNFGFFGVGIGALALGLAVRFLMRWLLRFDGSVEFAWLITVWFVARFLADESFLMAQYAARAWLPVLLLTFIVVKLTPRWRSP